MKPHFRHYHRNHHLDDRGHRHGGGAGYIVLSLFAAFIVLIVLILLIYVQERIEDLHQARTYRIVCAYQQETLDKYEELFKEYGMQVIRNTQDKPSIKSPGAGC